MYIREQPYRSKNSLAESIELDFGTDIKEDERVFSPIMFNRKALIRMEFTNYKDDKLEEFVSKLIELIDFYNIKE